MTDIPAPPDYPPPSAEPVTWWIPAEPTIEGSGFDWARLRLAYNGTALAAGVLASPVWLRVLHVFGDQYAAAGLFVLLAAWADRRHQTWLTRALLCTVTVAALLDQTSIRELVLYLTGVQL